MKTKRIPARTCTGCGGQFDKNTLVRILKTPEDTVVFDETGKRNGRGAYICNRLSCFQTAKKRKALERSLKISISPEVYDRIEKEMVEHGAE